MTYVRDYPPNNYPTYPRTGVRQIELTGSGTTQGTAAEVSAKSGHTLVIVDVSSGNTAIKLPDLTDDDVGSRVEVHVRTSDASQAKVFPQSGGAIYPNGVNASVQVTIGVGRTFLYADTDTWYTLGPES
jgi:hypothetical protein